LAIYVALATALLAIRKHIGVAPSSAEGCLLLSILASYASLFVVSIILVCWRQLVWGWTILVATTAAFMLFFWVLLPWLAKAKAY
jgi:hypothetical protein